MRSKTPILVPLLPQETSSDRLVPSILRLANLLELLEGDADFFRRLLDLSDRAMHHPDDAPIRELIEAGRGDDAFGRLLLDRVVPALARRLGDEWERDALSFADVTIASARLQNVVRQVDPPSVDPDEDAIVLIVPPWEQHTLPGTLVAREIRRRGVAVRHCVGFDADVVARVAETGHALGFLVSVGSIQSLERLPGYLTRLRRNLTRVRPVIIGGPAIDGIEVRPRRYGADHFANDAAEALALCGLSTSYVSTADAGGTRRRR